jgi:cobaltochelatase CobN
MSPDDIPPFIPPTVRVTRARPPGAGLMLSLMTIVLALLLMPAVGIAAPRETASVLFIATGNVPAGKFRLLAEIGREHGITADIRYVDKLPAEAGPEVFAGYDAVFFDTYLQDMVRGKLARALPGLKAPQVWLYDGQPAWSGLPDALSKRLVAYYANGSRANFENWFRTLAAHLAGQSTDDIPDPIVFPKSGVYHPTAPGLVFNSAREYFTWKKVDPAKRPPTVAIALHQQYIASEQTAFIDDLIARIESNGAVALAVYCPAMEPDALKHILSIGEQPAADALINAQIMLNAEGRRAEFEALGIPVVQAMPYRKGDAAAWAADEHGIAMMDIPFYLAQSEYAGVTDIQIAAATRQSDEQILSIPAQAAAVVGKTLNLVELQRRPNAEKNIALMFWNYPPGEKNLSASFLNLPRSLDGTLAALKDAGYATSAPGHEALTADLQRLLAPFYRDGELDGLLRDNLAALLPVADYRAWLATLPDDVRTGLLTRWGEPEQSRMVITRDGQPQFVIPRLQLGNIAILPQSPRGEKWDEQEKTLYHSLKSGPSHFYLANYLWLRQRDAASGAGFGAHALVHYGTHGTQEWLPGKERGLSVHDFPMLAVGDLPVAYPYIADDVGEAIQAKRRGRAVIVSHQTPPFSPAGLHAVLIGIHDLLHAWLAQDEGAVREKIKADLLAAVTEENIARDMGWSDERLTLEWTAFVDALHTHLHELAQTAQPMGLHTFGTAPAENHRLGTVLMMLGKPFWEAAAGPGEEADEMLVEDYEQLTGSSPYKLLKRHVLDDEPVDALPPALREQLARARQWYADLSAANEQTALLTVLAGRHLSTSYGGDPIKNPDAYPTGHNMYGFDPSRVPTPQAWEAGKEALENLLAAHREQSGATPKKLTFALWSVETMRHMGLLEAQALWALGVEPVWDDGGRVTGVKLVSREQLGRPRVDVVLSATGLYRDHFPNAMKQLAEAARLASEADEADNPVAANALAITTQLEQRGIAKDAARRAGQTRIFSSESGRYGTGLDDATLATDSWQGKTDGDGKLAALYLSRMQYAYGPDEAEWGNSGVDGQDVNLYAEHLKGTEGAVLSRTSNLYGMLTTDDPFQYLGGIALAVRHLDGQAPQLYISNLRGNGAGRVDSAARFLSMEMATRQFHPGYIKGLMAEGYAGTLQVLDATNNFWGWTAVAREIVRDDQWQELVDVYVRDKHELGLREWFERENPTALAQTMERMLEAARKGYWNADAATVEELKERWKDLAQRFDVHNDSAAFRDFVGYGLTQAQPEPATDTPAATQATQTPAAPDADTEAVRGMKLEKQSAAELPPAAPLLAAVLLVLLIVIGAGMLSAVRDERLHQPQPQPQP